MSDDRKISKYTKSLIKGELIRIKVKKKKKYTRDIIVDKGFNQLRYYAVVKRYLSWKYEITGENLEFMYYLYGEELFSRRDFENFPLRWGRFRLRDLIADGFIINIFPERKGKQVFTLSKKAKIMVQMAHKLLSGEMEMPVNPVTNKVFRNDASYSMLNTRSIMEEMREQMKDKFKG